MQAISFQPQIANTAKALPQTNNNLKTKTAAPKDKDSVSFSSNRATAEQIEALAKVFNFSPSTAIQSLNRFALKGLLENTVKELPKVQQTMLKNTSAMIDMQVGSLKSKSFLAFKSQKEVQLLKQLQVEQGLFKHRGIESTTNTDILGTLKNKATEMLKSAL